MADYSWVVFLSDGTPNFSGDLADPNNWTVTDQNGTLTTPAGPLGSERDLRGSRMGSDPDVARTMRWMRSWSGSPAQGELDTGRRHPLKRGTRRKKAAKDRVAQLPFDAFCSSQSPVIIPVGNSFAASSINRFNAALRAGLLASRM